MRENEGGPGDIEEQDVKGGGPRGICGKEEDGESGDGGGDGGEGFYGTAGSDVRYLDELPCSIEERRRRALEEVHGADESVRNGERP